MGAALNTAGAKGGLPLVRPRHLDLLQEQGDLDIAVAGDSRLFNQYGVILVNPAKHATVKKDAGQAFIDWLISADGQAAIAAYKINGQQLFFPNANKS